MAYLESKPRYEILDGLRGVAALTVVMFHLAETYFWGDPVHQHINHGYLAVDFFFVLSGFVVGYAYDDRWGKMGTIGFFKRRLIRLHPMIAISIVFGMLMFYFRGGDIAPQTAWYYVLWMMWWQKEKQIYRTQRYCSASYLNQSTSTYPLGFVDCVYSPR